MLILRVDSLLQDILDQNDIYIIKILLQKHLKLSFGILVRK